MRALAVLALGLVVATPAVAAERTGFQAIAAGNYAMAERQISAALRESPARPELMLNMAAVYMQTGRVAEARAMYAAVLGSPAVAVDMPSGAIVSSHDVAARGLQRLPKQTFATR
jgi:thioredoxin-like negative regulator of GroEL